MMLDTDTPILEELIVNGDLIFDDTKSSVHL